MAKIEMINLKGEKVKDVTLSDSIWKNINDIVLKKAIDLQLASMRQGTHKTKTRAEVSGGGKKPWKQKGTGRAYKLKNKELVIIDGIKLESLKTKEIKQIMANLKLDGKTLFVTNEDNENLYMATRNLGYAYAICADEINVYDLINAEKLVLDEAALNRIEEVLK